MSLETKAWCEVLSFMCIIENRNRLYEVRKYLSLSCNISGITVINFIFLYLIQSMNCIIVLEHEDITQEIVVVFVSSGFYSHTDLKSHSVISAKLIFLFLYCHDLWMSEFMCVCSNF
jgi:hypothetical protein